LERLWQIVPLMNTAAQPPERQPATGEPTAENVKAIVELEREGLRQQHWSERLSARISALAGSLTFVLIHIACFAGWALWNRFAPGAWRFDPYPYGLLTFIVSMEGVLIATFVLITQNRMNIQSDRRDRLNLQVDLLAEQEMTLMLRMLRRISDRLEIPTDNEEAARAEKLAEETNVYDLVRQFEREMPAPGTDGGSPTQAR
jgi:uncharacterized membrane protein